MTYKVIVRDPKFGTEEYIDDLKKDQAIAEAVSYTHLDVYKRQN